jgi:hypothetical protein
MSQSVNVLSSLNGNFKERYGELKNLIPDGVKVLNMIKFSQKDRNGNFYHAPVILGQEHGVTFASSEDDAFNLNPPISGQMKDVTIKGTPMVLRSALGYVTAQRALAGGETSFMDATKYLISNMLRSMTKKLEITCLYGQSGWGSISAVSGADITIKTSQWAPGIWAAAQGMPIEIRDYLAVGASPTSSTSRGEFTVIRVDFENRKLTLNAAPAGVVVTSNQEDVIFHKGAFGNEFAGIHKILSTTTGTLFGVSVADFDMFKANSYDAAGALSFTKLNLATSRAVEKGLEGKLVCLCNPRGWANMLNDQASLRQYDQSYSSVQLEQGARALKFFSQNGEIEIIPSIYIKEGFSYLLSMDEWKRIGSTDVTFKRPGKEGEFFRELENSAGYELRLFSDQAIFCQAPARNVLITGIVNAAS